MAHENKHEVINGPHVYENGVYKKVESKFQEFPKYADDGVTTLANKKEESEYFEKKKLALKKKEESKVPVVA